MSKVFPRKCNLMAFLAVFGGLFPLISHAQTDETIFREFRFDFSTPGARANALGRAFVGLADEATAAYNNPAGLSVLKSPEFTLEYRFDQNAFAALRSNDIFEIIQEEPNDTEFDLDRIGFASYAFSARDFNFSLFYVNNLDYRREPVNETINFLHRTEEYRTTYINTFEVGKIQLNSYGFSLSRDFGKLDLGLAVAMTTLSLDFEYFTSLNSFRFGLSDLVNSQTEQDSSKPAWVLGALYEVNSKLKLGLSYKRQPSFVYSEQVNNLEYPSTQFPDRADIPVTFKVPDSLQIGMAYQPGDLWTLVLDCEWVQYEQLVADTTILSRARTLNTLPTGNFFTFDKDDYNIQERPAVHLGVEHLIPSKGNIFALRAGGFYAADQKTRFTGTTGNEDDQPLYDIQSFIFNTDVKSEEVGYTVGLGFVWHDKLQVDLALVESDRFRRLVTSFLYRF